MRKLASVLGALLLLIIFLAACTGCGNEPQVSGNSINSSAASAVGTVESSNPMPSATTSSSGRYTITGTVASKNDGKVKYEIKYPQVAGLSDSALQEELLE